MVIALVVAGVVLLAGVGVGLFLLLTKDLTNSRASGTAAATTSDLPGGPTSDGGGIPPATAQPDGLGSDAGLDSLAQACYVGDMASCDLLYNEAQSGSQYGLYGDTCAGRQPAGTLRACRDAFPR
jgi:hypothetical protein